MTRTVKMEGYENNNNNENIKQYETKNIQQIHLHIITRKTFILNVVKYFLRHSV